MNILQLIDSLDAGGAERMAVNIANANVRAGFKSYLCSTVRSGPLESFIDERVTFLVLRKKRMIDMPAFRHFFKYVKAQEIAIIHAHSTSIQLAVLTKMRFPKIKVVWHDHYGLSDQISKRSSTKLKVIAPFIDAVVAVNENLALWSKNTLDIKNVFFINNFIELPKKISPQTTLNGATGKRVLCLANFRSQKNHLELIRAFKESIKDNSSWTLHLVGKDFGDNYSKSINELIQTEKLENNVYCYGSCPDVAHILSQATIGVLASISEGLPLSLLEYASAGLPVITTNVGQCAEVVGTDGRLITNVMQELPKALEILYDIEVDMRLKLGSSFRESIKERYSEHAFMSQLQPIYQELVPSSSNV